MVPTRAHPCLMGAASGGLGRPAQVMLFLEQWYSVPSVLLVVQGGPNTLATILEAISAGTPVVVVVGTGGAADAVAGFRAGWCANTRSSTFSLAEYDDGRWLPSDANLRQLCEVEAPLGLLFPIELRDTSEGLDAAILRAIVKKQARAPSESECFLRASQSSPLRTASDGLMMTPPAGPARGRRATSRRRTSCARRSGARARRPSRPPSAVSCPRPAMHST